MKTLVFLILTISFFVYSDEIKEQQFGEYTGEFKVKSVNYSYYLVSFSGSEWASGEVIFEVNYGDGNEYEIHKVSFIPDELEKFPVINKGFYAKKLVKIDLLNHEKAQSLFFTGKEWEEAVLQRSPFISKKGNIRLTNYATSVECDSRHYFAEIINIQKNDDLALYSKNRVELMGC